MERGMTLSSPYLTDWSSIFILLSHDWMYCCGTMLLNTNPHDKPSHRLIHSVCVSCTTIISQKNKTHVVRLTSCCPERYWINLDTSPRGITVVGVWMELPLPHIANGRPDLYTSLHVLLQWPEALTELIFSISVESAPGESVFAFHRSKRGAQSEESTALLKDEKI